MRIRSIALLTSLIVVVMLSGCATTSINQYVPSESRSVGSGTNVKVGAIVNRTGHKDPRQIRFNVKLDVPVVDAVRHVLISELQQAGFVVGNGMKELSVAVNSLVYGKSGTSLTFTIRDVRSGSILYNKTHIEKGGAIIYSGGKHIDKLRKCILKFIEDRDAKAALRSYDVSQELTTVSKPTGSEKTPIEDKIVPVSDVDRNIPRGRVEYRDAVALIIGNCTYDNSDIPDVTYACHDATIMKEYLLNVFGFAADNVLFLENADLSEFNRVFGKEGRYKGRLYDYVKPDKSEVFVYYSGHGAPDILSKTAYMLPSDADPSSVAQTGYNLKTLFENLSQIRAKSYTVVIDACFSGLSDAGSLMGQVSPIYIEADPMLSLPNGTVFTSSRGDQVSTWYPEQQHGLFTYFFLKGLRGEADADGDKTITVGEMETYLTDPADGVPYWARRLKSREQTPAVIAGDKNKVVVELR